MAQLHNRISRRELKEMLRNDPTPRSTISFYNYTPIQDPTDFRNKLYQDFLMLGVLGRVYIAHEGINAQISVPTTQVDDFQKLLYSMDGFNGLRLNVAVDSQSQSFFVLDIKVRRKIVADGIEDPQFSMENKGRYVNAAQMNELMDDPDTVVIDMRNHYEYEVGHFVKALEIPSDTFREQLPMAVDMMKENKESNIIMYCTGGIRCEKASAFLLHKGFKNVFHLEGGIINYAHQVKELGLESKFIGKNFVFDERLGERITNDIISTCHQCGMPADTHTNCLNDGCHLLFIQCSNCAKEYDGCCSVACQETTHLPEERKKELRKGIDLGRNVFNKSRQRKPDLKKKL